MMHRKSLIQLPKILQSMHWSVITKITDAVNKLWLFVEWVLLYNTYIMFDEMFDVWYRIDRSTTILRQSCLVFCKREHYFSEFWSIIAEIWHFTDILKPNRISQNVQANPEFANFAIKINDFFTPNFLSMMWWVNRSFGCRFLMFHQKDTSIF